MKPGSASLYSSIRAYSILATFGSIISTAVEKDWGEIWFAVVTSDSHVEGSSFSLPGSATTEVSFDDG